LEPSIQTMTILRRVYRLSFNMQSFGGPSLKPTMLLTNNLGAGRLHKRGVEAKSRFASRVATTRRYVDQKGKQRWAGTPNLKASQILGPYLFTSPVVVLFCFDHGK
ncbi:unnamed protein product, partial [Durusdinium trenchii]